MKKGSVILGMGAVLGALTFLVVSVLTSILVLYFLDPKLLNLGELVDLGIIVLVGIFGLFFTPGAGVGVYVFYLFYKKTQKKKEEATDAEDKDFMIE